MNNIAPAQHPQFTDVWERRFEQEGRLWGDDASPPAQYLTKRILSDNAKILEIGAGYGRDSGWFVESGHKVTAIDRAANALTIASESLLQKISSRDIVYIAADFRDAAIGAKTQDVFFSHRVLHLLGNNGVTAAFAKMAGKVLKPEGHLLVTARSFKDFNPDQMEWDNESQGIAKYRSDVEQLGDRRGQVLHFWNEQKLRDLFQDNFENITVKDGTEIESVNNLDNNGNPVLTHYVSISARRKYVPEIR